MANNSNHGNQPRRKRNKKPVKRYSEEYSNRPNPYTGYSADGNYHPGAKKRSIEEESTPLRASHSTFDSGDYSRAAMTDAVLPPASANRGGYGVRSGIQPQGNTQPAPASGGSQEPVSRNYTEKAMPRPSVPMQEESSGSAAAADDDIVRLAETASHLENQKKDNPSQVTSHSTGSSHRKKNNSHRQTEEIRKAKTEARKALPPRRRKRHRLHRKPNSPASTGTNIMMRLSRPNPRVRKRMPPQRLLPNPGPLPPATSPRKRKHAASRRFRNRPHQ